MRLSLLWFDASSLTRILDTPALAGLFFASALAYALIPLGFAAPYELLGRFSICLVAMAGLLVLAFGTVRALGSKVSPPWFFTPVLQTLSMSLWFCLAIRLVALAVDFALGSHRISEVIYSLTPLYSFAIFGVSVDRSSQLQDRRAVIAGCIMVILFSLMSLVIDFPLTIPG